MKTKRRRIVNNILKTVLILLECMAVVNCCAVINVYSQINHIERIQKATFAAFSEGMDSVNLNTPADKAVKEYEAYIEELNRWKGPVLSKGKGTVMGPSGKETYYNLNMSGVVNIMRSMGNTDEYWVRDDGCKMLGEYIMVAANLNIHPRGSIVETSLGKAIVCDTGGFASRNPYQLDIAVTW